jgi:hypothetical protein
VLTAGNRKKPSLLNILLHIGVWVILFSLPVLFFPGELSSFKVVFRMNWVFLFFAGILFYLNYFYLVDLFIFDKKTIWFIVINILLIGSFTILNDLIIELWHGPMIMHIPGGNGPGSGPGPGPEHGPMFKPDRRMMYIRNAGTYFVPVIISIALRVMSRITKVEAEKKDIEHEHLQSELLHLKHQLHPHFFFNSLNNIYALVDISPEKSKIAIHGLAKLIRYLLYETDTERVKLSQEIEFLKQYIQLMQLRLNDKTKLTATFPENTADIDIAPLLFLPLVENVFKHGVAATDSAIVIELQISTDGIVFISQNDYQPIETELDETGIGIENLKKRLKLLYPGKYEFRTEIKNGIFSTYLLIRTF